MYALIISHDIPTPPRPRGRLATAIPQTQRQRRVQCGPRHGAHGVAAGHDDEANGQAVELVRVLGHWWKSWPNRAMIWGNLLGESRNWN